MPRTRSSIEKIRAELTWVNVNRWTRTSAVVHGCYRKLEASVKRQAQKRRRRAVIFPIRE